MPGPRSAGKLKILGTVYSKGVFSVEMLFITSSVSIGEDEAKSASLVVGQQFLQLLHQHGFRSYGQPQVYIKKRELRSLLFYVGCSASRNKPSVITIRTPESEAKKAEEEEAETPIEESKPNGHGGSEVGDKA